MTSEPERKKAKTDHKDSSTADDSRVKELQDKILALKEKYPELGCIDQLKLHSCLGEAFVKYKSEQGRLENERHCPIYKLPNEILQKCFEFVGGDGYLFTATVSKKFHDAFTSKFVSKQKTNNGKLTSYRYGACSTSSAKYCVETCCKTQDEKDQIFIAGAVNGNIEILEYALVEGYDLLPTINCFGYKDIKKWGNYFEPDLRYIQLEVVIGSPDEVISRKHSSKPCSIARIAREGHLHVLKYLYEKVNFRMGMQLASYEAIRNGHLDILEWLHSIDYLEELSTIDDGFERLICFCDEDCPAEVLKWLIERGYYKESNHNEYSSFYWNVLEFADKDLLDYCLSKGVEFGQCEEAIDRIARSGNIEFAEYCQEKGLRMTSGAYYYAIQSSSLEMVKFLHRSGIPWCSEYHRWTSAHAAKSNDLEILQYLHRNGCPWHPDTFKEFLLLGMSNTVETLPTIEVFRFLYENGCPWDKCFSRGIVQKVKDISFLKYMNESGLPYDNDLLELALRQQWFDGVKYIIESKKYEIPKNCSQKIIEMKDISLLKYLHESGLQYDRYLLATALRQQWLDGVKYIIESEMKCEKPADLGSVIYSDEFWFRCHDIEVLKYLKSTGMEWGKSESVFEGIVSSDSEFKDCLEVFHWAIESGCPFDEESEDKIFYWAFHSWLADPFNKQKREILSYLQKRGVAQGNVFHKYHEFHPQPF
ncbi:hypothetical protein CTEN210_11474 [Chaetoceros tenuissimus]|uniref:F-box domain-containing protein n=1 Tax=Chaetoceros tenuissimus TaxID=426638 RepID=A0AAD3CZE0_9STRA|nr:hypothetical protein CTEN210_11474 [Chaetoceros tenuissimus]